MKVFVTVMEGHYQSEKMSKECIHSYHLYDHPWHLETWKATWGKEQVEYEYKKRGITSFQLSDWNKGLIRRGGTKEQLQQRLLSKKGCSMSRLRLFEHCVSINENIMQIEHDTIFTKRIPDELIKKFNANDEYGMLTFPTSTHKVKQKDVFTPIKYTYGNHLWIIKPWAAQAIIEKIDSKKEFGQDTWMEKKFDFIVSAKDIYYNEQKIARTSLDINEGRYK